MTISYTLIEFNISFLNLLKPKNSFLKYSKLVQLNLDLPNLAKNSFVNYTILLFYYHFKKPRKTIKFKGLQVLISYNCNKTVLNRFYIFKQLRQPNKRLKIP